MGIRAQGSRDIYTIPDWAHTNMTVHLFLHRRATCRGLILVAMSGMGQSILSAGLYLGTVTKALKCSLILWETGWLQWAVFFPFKMRDFTLTVPVPTSGTESDPLFTGWIPWIQCIWCHFFRWIVGNFFPGLRTFLGLVEDPICLCRAGYFIKLRFCLLSKYLVYSNWFGCFESILM